MKSREPADKRLVTCIRCWRVTCYMFRQVGEYAEMNMNVIYNSDNYYVVEYAPQHGFELVDKQTQRGAFFQGDTASRFAQSLRDVVGEDSVSMERVDEFLGGFDDWINQPVLCH